MMDKPVPIPDRDSEPYWVGVRAGELRLQRCSTCGAWRWPARAICNRCRSFETEWRAVSGLGMVVSWIRTHQPFMRAYASETPYVTLQVQLDEQADIQMIGSLADPGIVPRIGMRVRSDFISADNSPPLIVWRPIDPTK